MRIPRGIAAAALAISACFFFLGILFPLVAIAIRAGGSDLLNPEVLAVTWATSRQAALSTLLSALLGLPLGLFAGALDERWRARVLAWLRVPYGVPTIVAATAWVTWLGRSGPLAALDLAYSFSAVVIAHVFFNAPWIALLVAEARAEIPELLLDAARSLGANPRARFLAVLWPSVRGALASGAAQTFAICSMSFALVLILGGGPPVDTLETSLYSRMRSGGLDLSGAAACALWELLLTLSPWILVLMTTKKAVHKVAIGGLAPSSRLKGRAILACALFFCVPYLAVFTPSALGALASREGLSQLARPLFLSVAIAVLSSIGALVASVSALLGASWLARIPGRAGKVVARLLEIAVTLPAGLSVIVLGLGMWLAYARFLDPLSGSLAAIVILQTLVFTPIAFRALWPLAERTRPGLLEAAQTLGAGPVRAFFAIEWPRWRPPLQGAAVLVAAASLGEVAAASLFYSERLIPLPLVISRWMAQYHFAEAQGLSALLLALSVAVMLVFGRRHA